MKRKLPLFTGYRSFVAKFTFLFYLANSPIEKTVCNPQNIIEYISLGNK